MPGGGDIKGGGGDVRNDNPPLPNSPSSSIGSPMGSQKGSDKGSGKKTKKKMKKSDMIMKQFKYFMHITKFCYLFKCQRCIFH